MDITKQEVAFAVVYHLCIDVKNSLNHLKSYKLIHTDHLYGIYKNYDIAKESFEEYMLGMKESSKPHSWLTIMATTEIDYGFSIKQFKPTYREDGGVLLPLLTDLYDIVEPQTL